MTGILFKIVWLDPSQFNQTFQEWTQLDDLGPGKFLVFHQEPQLVLKLKGELDCGVGEMKVSRFFSPSPSLSSPPFPTHLGTGFQPPSGSEMIVHLG